VQVVERVEGLGQAKGVLREHRELERGDDLLDDFVEARGIAAPVLGSYSHENDNEVARIDAASVRAAVLELGAHPAVDAVFVACTSLRLAAVVEEIERSCGKPALSSNHAMAWHALRLAGYREPVPGFGRLFRI